MKSFIELGARCEACECRVVKIDCETATAYSEDGRAFSADLLVGDGTRNREGPAVTHDLVAFMKTIPASAFAHVAKPGSVFTKRRQVNSRSIQMPLLDIMQPI
ncbi:hypothetical protein AC578_8775 [Pseudocercospora eumusae]|uniref:Uncharacterized protein n=1 Tax=Pseudocercospora eumusae TaxID=321146 RepID=A0A139H6J7_9PEZI|nr:hypothetical protein AC578_8775 [Pseudocercospora eumusae]